MRTRAFIAWLSIGFAVTAAHDASPVFAETEVAGAHFDPATVQLLSGTPEHAVLQALRAGDRVRAASLARAALPGAAEPALGRLRWLYFRASPEAEPAVLALRALASSAHPLAASARSLVALRDAVKSPAGAAVVAPAPVDPFAQADALLSARKFDKAEKAYAALSRDKSRTAEGLCNAKYGRARALLGNKRNAEAIALFEDVAATCSDEDTLAWARFFAARTLLRTGEPQRALSHYDALAHAFPHHRLADDALYAGAQAARDLGDTAAAIARLRELCDLHRDGDMLPEARFLLAWQARKDGRLAEALFELEHAIDEDTGGGGEDLIGRADYWRARTLLDLGRGQEANDAFAKLLRDKPLTYYAQQALARLQERDPARAASVLGELRDPLSQEKLLFAWRSELDSPHFTSAIELLRVGETARALSQLHGAKVFAQSSDDELFFLGLSLLHEAGAHSEAASLSRRRAQTIMSQVPRGRARALWRLSYPQAFNPLIEQVAREARVPAAFVRAVAREESSFDPNAMSPASAYGLIQLIVPTARAHGKLLGLPSDPAALRRPEVNLRIGASFMRSLFSRYVQNPALVPAAYNAGPGAADRWLRERPTQPLDEWIESIPYSETRRYTRRVLQSYGVYAWLDDGVLPKLAARLPQEGAADTREALSAAKSIEAAAEPDAQP